MIRGKPTNFVETRFAIKKGIGPDGWMYEHDAMQCGLLCPVNAFV